MTIVQQQEAIKGAYPGPRWTQRVKGMSEAQITAVYLRLKRQGKI